MASLRRRWNTWHIRYYSGGKLRERSLGIREKSEALLELRRYHQSVAAGPGEPPPGIPIGQFLREYLSHMLAHRKKKSAMTDIGRLRRFFEACPVRHLEDLSARHVQEFLDEKVLKKDIGPKTANEYRVCLHALVEFAIRYRDFVSSDRQFANPVKRVKRFRVPRREIRFLTLAQIDEQLKALEPWPDMRTLAAICIYGGLRRGEAVWLTADDVKPTDNPPLIHIRVKEINGDFWEPKTKIPRVVPISRALRAILCAYALQRRGGSVWFLPSPRGCRWDEDNLGHKFAKIQKKLGLEWTFLDFRHSFGSHLVQKGESLYKVSKLMGNSPDICRRHYAALVPEQMLDTVEFAVNHTSPAVSVRDAASR
jgi:integrase